MSPLSRLAYLSRMSDAVEKRDIDDIVSTSRDNNRIHHITGILCAGGSQFAQILEGPQSNILQLYGRILSDLRHYDCLLIGISPIQQRLFEGWDMGYLAHDAETMEQRRRELMASWKKSHESRELLRHIRAFLVSMRD